MSTSRSRGKRARQSGSASQNQPQVEPQFHDLESQQKFYQTIQSRDIINGRVFDAQTFGSNGLMVTQKFRQQGLLLFISLDNNIYPTLVRLFYANLHLTRDEITNTHLHNEYASYLHGNMITFRAHMLRDCFHLPHGNNTLTIYRKDQIILDREYDKLNAINVICEMPRNTTVASLKAKDLTLNCRIIHHVLGLCLLPKSGGRDQLTELEIYLVWAIWTNRPLDWANIIFANLGQGLKRKDANLPYGIALTSLFRFFDVNLALERDIYRLTTTDFYSSRNIALMGYTFDENNDRWIKKGADREAPPHQGGDGGEIGRDPTQASESGPSQTVPALPAPPTLDDIMNAINALDAKMESRFAKMYLHQQHSENAIKEINTEYAFPDWSDDEM